MLHEYIMTALLASKQNLQKELNKLAYLTDAISKREFSKCKNFKNKKKKYIYLASPTVLGCKNLFYQVFLARKISE